MGCVHHEQWRVEEGRRDEHGIVGGREEEAKNQGEAHPVTMVSCGSCSAEEFVGWL